MLCGGSIIYLFGCLRVRMFKSVAVPLYVEEDNSSIFGPLAMSFESFAYWGYSLAGLRSFAARCARVLLFAADFCSKVAWLASRNAQGPR